MLANCCAHDTIVARRQPSKRNPQLDRREVAISRHSMPELRLGLWPSPNRGRRESRVPTAPAVSCAKRTVIDAHEHTGSAETARLSPRNGFTAYFVLSPVSGLCCHRHLAKNFPQGLAPASRRQDHTTSPYALAFSSGAKKAPDAKASTASRAPRVVTIMIRPLLWARDGRSYNSDFQNCEAKYF